MLFSQVIKKLSMRISKVQFESQPIFFIYKVIVYLFYSGFYRSRIGSYESKLTLLRSVIGSLAFGITYSICLFFIDDQKQLPFTVYLFISLGCFIVLYAIINFIRDIASYILYTKSLNTNIKRNVLIYGAGAAGLQLLNAIRDDVNINLVGLFDDSNNIKGSEVSGYRVFGKKSHLVDLRAKHTNLVVYLAIPSISSEDRQKIITKLEKLKIAVRTMPGFHELVSNDKKLAEERRNESMIFITEGDSASGSITKTRDVQTQAVFSLRGKPFNCYAHTKKVVYENEEFNLLQHALNIEDGLEGLRYKKIIIATDADVDGMHIRLLLLTYFLQFFPELVRNGHVFILDTPLFRIRNKKETFYCYDEQERQTAIEKLGKNAEITRFKGLGEISPNEFAAFIGEDIHLEPVILTKETKIKDLLSFYMGKNTPDRQQFIIHKLRVEKDLIHKEKETTSEEYEIT